MPMDGVEAGLLAACLLVELVCGAMTPFLLRTYLQLYAFMV